MTIASATNRNDYTGSASTDTYPYTFKIFAETDLLVTVRDTAGVEATLTVNVDYTVTGVGVTAGGTIVLIAGNLATDYHLTIRRQRPLLQGTDIRNQGDFFPEVHEDALDDLVMQLQTLQVLLNRSVKIAETDEGITVDLPVAEALKLLRWNAAGTAMELVSVTDLSALLSSVDASLTIASGTLSVTLPIRQGVAGGTVDAITTTTSPAIPALVNGVRVLVQAAGANTSTTPTFAPDGLTAKTIVKGNNQAVVAGDIPGANLWIDLVYDGTLDAWVLLNPAYPVSLLPVITCVRDTFRNLVVQPNSSNPTFQVDITADELFLQNAAGTTLRAAAVAVTADITVSGANGLDTGAEASATWYYLWVISNGTTVAALLSVSSTAPTLPSGYTYMALVGAVRNNGSSNFLGFYQQDRHVEYHATQAVIDGTVVASTWTALVVSGVFPATARRVRCVLGGDTGTEELGLSPRSDGHAGVYFHFAEGAANMKFNTALDSSHKAIATAEVRYAATLYYWIGNTDGAVEAVGWEY